MYPIADVVLDTPARRLSLDGRDLALTTVEFEILARLVQSAGAVVGRERLVAEVFERQFSPEDRALDVHISRLRKKLGPHASLIVTIRGVGHLLRAPAAPVAPVAPAAPASPAAPAAPASPASPAIP